jgi:hypothetical protein
LEGFILFGVVEIFIESLALLAVDEFFELELLLDFFGLVEVEVAFELGVQVVVRPAALEVDGTSQPRLLYRLHHHPVRHAILRLEQAHLRVDYAHDLVSRGYQSRRYTALPAERKQYPLVQILMAVRFNLQRV